MQKKSSKISTRIPPDLRERLDAINARHGTTDSTIGLQLYLAFCDYVEKYGKVEFPIQIIATSSLKMRLA